MFDWRERRERGREVRGGRKHGEWNNTADTQRICCDPGTQMRERDVQLKLKDSTLRAASRLLSARPSVPPQIYTAWK